MYLYTYIFCLNATEMKNFTVTLALYVNECDLNDVDVNYLYLKLLITLILIIARFAIRRASVSNWDAFL
ncbi:hypothetical protein ANAPC5_01377 [Anaplasma phagocytophilum]|nr:hypothetical protein ANAPC5_01377 [Anaplasma phagocytophilum]